jgi:low affinity Fe/Cu permease
MNSGDGSMTEAQIRAEMQYRIQERIGIMVEDMDTPPNEVVTIAMNEAEQWRIRYEADTKAAPGAD